MDLNKRNEIDSGQGSDDLIAELARLVAQDARGGAARPAAPVRQEPAFAPKPERQAQAEPEPFLDSDWKEDGAHWQDEPAIEAAPQNEPVFSAHAEPAPQPSVPPVDFDFGFGTHQAVETSESAQPVDPIADLIADAEVDAYARDIESDAAPQERAPDGYFDAFEPVAEPQAPAYYGDDEPQVSAAQPAPERDPLSEIEALIGEAARSAVTDAGIPRRVRSSFLHTGADGEDRDDADFDSAEAAIMAAAAATGVSSSRSSAQTSGRHEPDFSFADDFGDAPQTAQAAESEPYWDNEPELGAAVAPAADRDYRGEEPEDDEVLATEEDYDEAPVRQSRPRRAISTMLVPALAGTAILAVIAGGYFAFFAAPGEPGEAPILVADADPLKEAVDQPPIETTATGSVVFNEIEGNTASPEDEALVSRDQTGGASGSDIAGVLAPEQGEIALANRPVRTVTVRPDGTIVQGEDSMAGSSVLPVDRPDVPDVPNSTLTADPIGEAIAMAMAEAPETLEPLGQISLSDTPIAPVAAEIEASDTIDSDIPRPLPRPAGLGGSTTTLAAAPAASADPLLATPAAAAPTGTPPAAWVQLSSQRSEEVARAGMADLQARYGALFNGATPEVNRVDLGDRGIYYRVRLPQPSLSQANSVCSAIQGQGGECFVLNN